MVEQIPPPRQSKRFASFLVERDLDFKVVAEWLDVHPTRAGQIIRTGIATPAQVQALRDRGVPEDFLPSASRGRPGPIPGALSQRRAKDQVSA